MRVDVSNNNQYAMNSQADTGVKETPKIQSQLSEIPVNVPVDGEKKQVQEHDVIEAIEKANKHFKSFDRRLEFTIHDKTKQIMVKVIDTEDDSVIREIPSEKILDMVAKLWEMSGLFVDEKR